MIEAQKVQDAPPVPKSCPHITAIASGKGGVGKTWLSISLAHALSRLGKRTLLFDGDLGLANVDIQLGLQPDRDLGGVLSGNYDFKDAIERSEDAEIDILAGRSGSGSLASLPAGQLTAVSEQLRGLSGHYDQVILDLGAGIERTVRRLAALAGRCLVVTTDEPTSLTDAYAFIKLSHATNPNGDFRIVVNMAGSWQDGERIYATLKKACESFLKITPPLAGIIRRDDKVKEAIRHQKPLLTRYPNCPAAEDIEKLAKSLAEGWSLT